MKSEKEKKVYQQLESNYKSLHRIKNDFPFFVFVYLFIKYDNLYIVFDVLTTENSDLYRQFD